MRSKLALLVAGVVLAAAPALAQTAPQRGKARGCTPSIHTYCGGTTRSPGPPIDRGPFTADANSAYMGGGMILEGPPGAPAPAPQAMPPAGPRGVPAR